MKAYILCFTLTIIFTILAEKNLKKKNKKKAIFFSIIAIFIPTFICGIRNSEVGRDIEIYVSPILKQALKLNFLPYMHSSNTERGYMVFVYIISKISSSLNVLLFFIQLIPCTATFIFAYSYRKEIPMWFVMTTYLLTWYLRSYTMMRQSIAVAFILLSIITFQKKQIFKTIILFTLAVLFHKSAIVATGLYFVIYVCDIKKINFKSKIMIFAGLFVIMCGMIFFYESIIRYLSYDVGILPERFAGYLNSQFATEELQVSFSETMYRLIFILLGLLYCTIINKKEKKDTNFIKFFIFYLISMGPYIISFKVSNAERMNYYYYYPSLLYIVPGLTKIVKNNKVNKIIISTFLIAILFAFWFFKYPIKKNCETYPYKTEIIKFLN